MSNYNEDLEYYKQALKMYIELGDTLRTAYCYSGLGLTYEALGEHQQALDNHFKALKMRENQRQCWNSKRVL
jgi:tetratricopeptide (TPR) repeat protein